MAESFEEAVFNGEIKGPRWPIVYEDGSIVTPDQTDARSLMLHFIWGVEGGGTVVDVQYNPDVSEPPSVHSGMWHE